MKIEKRENVKRGLTNWQHTLLDEITDDDAGARVIRWDDYVEGPVIRRTDGTLCTITQHEIIYHSHPPVTTMCAAQSDGIHG